MPIPNPDFDPANYDPKDEGKQKAKARRNAKSPPSKAAQPDDGDRALRGWKMGSGTASVKDDIVTVRGEGEPFFGVEAGISDPAKVTFRVRYSACQGAHSHRRI